MSISTNPKSMERIWSSLVGQGSKFECIALYSLLNEVWRRESSRLLCSLPQQHWNDSCRDQAKCIGHRVGELDCGLGESRKHNMWSSTIWRPCNLGRTTK